ncbi:hypothetical protein D4R86_05695 [bacterium]|nr:MAG: hypothetical protein D4R86_05695 [bacterium]
MRQHTKKELADANKTLTAAQPLFEKLSDQKRKDENRWQNEIAMLERRVSDLYEDVDLGNGDLISVRTALSEKEMQELGNIDKEKAKLELGSEEVSMLTYQQLELMTANPLLTAEWFAENRDKWPVNDAVGIISAFLEELLKSRQSRVDNLKFFRNE